MATKIEYTPMRIIQTSKENAEKLLAGESITTAEGEVITFGMNDILVTPDDTVAKVSGLDNRVTALENATPPEIDTSKFVTTDTQQEITGAKTFINDIIANSSLYTADGAWEITSDGLGVFGSVHVFGEGAFSVSMHYSDGLVVSDKEGGDYVTIGYDRIIYDYNQEEVEHNELLLPRKSGTLATTDDVKKYYRHHIFIVESNEGHIVEFDIINSKATAYTSLKELADDYNNGTSAITANYLSPTGEYDGAVSFVYWGENVQVIGSTYSGNVAYNLYYEDIGYGINIESFGDNVHEL